MVLNILAKWIAQFLLKNRIIEEAENEFYEYGLELLLASVLELLAVIVISIFIGKLIFTVLFLLAFCVLRAYAGGYHADSHLKCFLTLLAVYFVFLLMIFLINKEAVTYLSVAFALISEILIISMAPIESENKPLLVEEKDRYKKISILIVSIESFIVLALFWLDSSKYFVFAVSYGQISAAISLAAVKILKTKRSNENDVNEKLND